MFEISETGWCSTPTYLLICSSFNRENGTFFLICSSLSTNQEIRASDKMVSFFVGFKRARLAVILEDRAMTRKWLVTMVIASPLSRVVGPLINGLFMAYKWGLLITY